MVRGLAIFQERFAAYADQYVAAFAGLDFVVDSRLKRLDAFDAAIARLSEMSHG